MWPDPDTVIGMADTASASDHGDRDRDLDPETIAAMSPDERARWMAHLEFTPVDEAEAGRLLATLPPQPPEPNQDVFPVGPRAGRPPLRRRGMATSGPDHPVSS